MQPEYEIKESARVKHLRIDVFPDGRVQVTKPAHISMASTERFIEARRKWVEEIRARFERSAKRREKKREKLGLEAPEPLPKPRRGSKAYKEAVKAARALAARRLAHFNAHYHLRYGTISIRNQKTRWGSCSATGALSFNYRIAYLPSDVADYLIVHELCHIREHNHSPRFWALVDETIPDYKKLRVQLQGYDLH